MTTHVEDRSQPVSGHYAAPQPVARAARWAPVVAVALGIQFLVSGLFQAWHDSPTVDEAIDVASGVTNLVHRDLRLAPEHGALPLLAAALPAQLADPVVPETKAYERGDWLRHTHHFVRENLEAGTLRETFFLARLTPLATALLGAYFLYRLGGRLGGPWGGVVAGGLWLTTPYVVGLAHFAMVDVAFAVATLGVVLGLVRLLERPDGYRAVVLGAALVAALLSRHTALAVVAAALLVLVVHHRRDWWRAARYSAIVGLVAWVGVFLLTRAFDPTELSGPAADRLATFIELARDDSLPARLVLAVPWPLEFRGGLAYLVHTSDPRPAYLFGEAWEGSRWWFFPGSALAKIPLPALIAVVWGTAAWRRIAPARRYRVGVPVATVAAALAAFLLAQPLNLGFRLALPIAALAFVAAGAVPLAVTTRPRIVLAGVLVAAQVVAFWWAHPHSLAWTQPPLRPGYRFVSDSNLDFGQDLYRLEDWSEGREPYVWLFRPRGWLAPDEVRSLRGTPLDEVRGWIAVSATALTVVHRDELSWLRAYCPVDTIGGSILVYRFTAPPDPAPGPEMPVPPCPEGQAASRR